MTDHQKRILIKAARGERLSLNEVPTAERMLARGLLVKYYVPQKGAKPIRMWGLTMRGVRELRRIWNEEQASGEDEEITAGQGVSG